MSDLTEATLAVFGWNTAKAGTATTLVGWMLSSQGIAVAGVLIGLTGLLVQWYYKRRQDRREQEEHDLFMRSSGNPKG